MEAKKWSLNLLNGEHTGRVDLKVPALDRDGFQRRDMENLALYY